MAISDRKKREKEQRIQSIIDAAEKLFFEKGYDNVSMNDIAQEVELNRATIYIYFENKEALCIAVILRGVRLLNKMVRNNVKNKIYTKKIIAWWNAHTMFFYLYPQYIQVYNLFQSGRFDLSVLKRPVWDDVREILKLQEEMFDMLHSAIKTEKGGGTISQDVDPFYATILIVSALDNVLNVSPILEKEIKDMKASKYKKMNKYQDFDFKPSFIHFIDQLLRKR